MTKQVNVRMNEIDLARIEGLKIDLGINSTTDVIRYALKVAEELHQEIDRLKR